MKLTRRFAFVTACLAFLVVVVGAYVRLSAAGLGCPDWPGCYGHPSPWHAATEIATAQSENPLGNVSPGKAWKEMGHRYLAGTLGLGIFILGGLAWRRTPPGRRILPGVLVALVIFQAMLGMWTVTLQLRPVVVASHLLGGMTTLALLAWLALDRGREARRPDAGLRRRALTALVLLVLQIALGGWTSANYAAPACPDFPTCRGELWPAMDVPGAFSFSPAPGTLPMAALTAIDVLHRLGAVLVLASALWLAAGLFSTPSMRQSGRLLILVVTVQFLLGMGNVLLSLPLPVAVAHNAGAALLLVVVIWINTRLKGDST
ncbi:MAG TPA: COX15/CtaA family protein [Parasulfuritortus sp.]